MIKNSTKKGFTLTEMLVVMGIVTILMTVLVFNYQNVNNKSILKNVAYDVALSIREIQSLGLGAKKYTNTSEVSSFSTPFGAQFNFGEEAYIMFADENGDNFCDNSTDTDTICACGSGADECLSEITPSAGGITFYDACVISGGTASCVNDTAGSYAAVIFKRPNPDAKIVYDVTGTPASGEIINIIFKSRKSNDGQAITITKTGQVSVIDCDLTDWDGVNDKKCGL